MTEANLEYIVDGILPAGLTVITAPPWRGKSWLCLQLGNSVAHGIPFLGKETMRGKVLYFDLTGGVRRTKERMQKAGFDESDDFLFSYICLSLGAGFLEQMKMCVENNPGTRLIIIDDFDHILGKTGPTQETLIHLVREWALSAGIAVVLVTDLLGKARYAQIRALDAVWVIKKCRRQNSLFIRGDHADPSDIPIHFDKHTCRWNA